MAKSGKILVGTSGYSYPHWREVIYPEGLPQGRWLEHYATEFDTVELNVTFYRLPKPAMFEAWRSRTPARFRFSVKGWRMVTHRKFLQDCDAQLKLFFESASALGRKLAVVLWQLPPQLQADLPRLARFLDAARAASPVRQTIEFRHASWNCREVFDLLSERNMAVCLADKPGSEIADAATADFTYARRHGPDGSYRDAYSAAELKRLAKKAGSWAAEGKDVFIYFNNDYAGHAVKNARQVLAELQ
jgi:uncharacterized protein YecE (DUF72 family)